jgi:hypothetical protein
MKGSKRRTTAARKPARGRLPPLPAAIPSPLGPVPVVLCPKIKRGKDKRFVFGKYNTAGREIHISQKASHVMQWQTLFHEWAHMVLHDAGLNNLLTSDQEEVFCEALGTARTHELMEWCRS